MSSFFDFDADEMFDEEPDLTGYKGYFFEGDRDAG